MERNSFLSRHVVGRRGGREGGGGGGGGGCALVDGKRQSFQSSFRGGRGVLVRGCCRTWGVPLSLRGFQSRGGGVQGRQVPDEHSLVRCHGGEGEAVDIERDGDEGKVTEGKLQARNGLEALEDVPDDPAHPDEGQAFSADRHEPNFVILVLGTIQAVVLVVIVHLVHVAVERRMTTATTATIIRQKLQRKPLGNRAWDNEPFITAFLQVSCQNRRGSGSQLLSAFAAQVSNVHRRTSATH